MLIWCRKVEEKRTDCAAVPAAVQRLPDLDGKHAAGQHPALAVRAGEPADSGLGDRGIDGRGGGPLGEKPGQPPDEARRDHFMLGCRAGRRGDLHRHGVFRGGKDFRGPAGVGRLRHHGGLLRGHRRGRISNGVSEPERRINSGCHAGTCTQQPSSQNTTEKVGFLVNQ